MEKNKKMVNNKVQSVKTNFIYQILYQTLISILPFLTSPYISRIFGADGVGIYTYTYAIVTYFRMFAALGISTYGNREIAKNRNNHLEMCKKFSSIFTLHTILSIVAIVMYICYWKWFVSENKIIALIQMIYLVSELVDISWFFWGIEQFRITLTRSVSMKIITVVCIFIFVKKPTDLWKYVLILAMGELVSISALWLFLHKYVSFTRFNFREMLQHLKPMIVLFFSVIATSIYSYMDRIMIGSMSSLDEVGYYENAMKMIIFPVGFITALGTVMLPKITNLVANKQNELISRYFHESMIFSMASASAIAFGVAAIAEDFSIIFWGKDFIVSGKLMELLSITIILMSWNSVVRSQILIPFEKDKVYVVSIVLGAFTNFIVNFFLIPKMGSFGAAIGTIITYCIIFLVQTIFVFRVVPIKKYICMYFPYLIIGIIMYISVKFASFIVGLHTIIGLILQIMLGVLVYLLLLVTYAYIFHDDMIKHWFSLIRKVLYRHE